MLNCIFIISKELEIRRHRQEQTQNLLYHHLKVQRSSLVKALQGIQVSIAWLHSPLT
jgi:gamma-glutamyl-gamma-aminobutyrate hydrolase PuuD